MTRQPESEAEYAATQDIGVPLTIADKLWNKSHLWWATEFVRALRSAPERPFEGPVYFQNEWWIDARGFPHRVEKMSLHYVRNVINFLERRAYVIHRRTSRAITMALIKLFDDLEQSSNLVDMTTRHTLLWREVMGEDFTDHAIAEIEDRFGDLDQEPLEWLRATPLLRALHARLG